MNQLIGIYAILLTVLSTIFPSSPLIGNLHAKLAKHTIDSDQNALSHLQNYPEVTYRSYPFRNQSATPYRATAVAAAIYDLDSGQYLYQKNQDARLPIASITKMVTALVILKSHGLNQTVTVPAGISLPADSERAGITAGEKFTVNEALHILLIKSANDMAEALATWDAGSRDKFITKMNEQAKQWGLNNTHFANPTGLDDKNNYSSASDLVLLTTILLQNKSFRGIVDTPQYAAKDQAGNQYNLVNTNKLLSLDYVHGVKTGLTAEAGQTLVTLAEKNNHSLIGVVLNSPNRFQESKNMIDWAFENYTWK